jgi:hypothetical protein
VDRCRPCRAASVHRTPDIVQSQTFRTACGPWIDPMLSGAQRW